MPGEPGGAGPLAGVPGIDITAGQARGTSERAADEDIALALDLGEAEPVPGGELVKWAGDYRAAAAGGWVRVPGLGIAPDRLTGEGAGPRTR
jgi:hypothetical protein